METTTREDAGTWALALERASYWRTLAAAACGLSRTLRLNVSGDVGAHYRRMARAAVRSSRSWPSPLDALADAEYTLAVNGLYDAMSVEA